MAILTMLCPPSLASTLNIPHCTKMALVHDMAECIVGDIIPPDNVSKQDKHYRERESMEYLCAGVGLPSDPDHPIHPSPDAKPSLLSSSLLSAAGNDLQAVWQEYEDGNTPEANFVHDVDKLELLLQMNEYERAGNGTLDLGEFARVAHSIQLEEMKIWMAQIFAERDEFWAPFQGRVIGAKDGQVKNLDWRQMLWDMNDGGKQVEEAKRRLEEAETLREEAIRNLEKVMAQEKKMAGRRDDFRTGEKQARQSQREGEGQHEQEGQRGGEGQREQESQREQEGQREAESERD